jgi:hypothetical protein
MPAEVIDRVHVLAHRTVGAGAAGLAFTDRIGNPFLDPDNGNSSIDETYAPDASDMDDDYDTDSEQDDSNDNHPSADIPISGAYDHPTDVPIAGVYTADENAKR